LILIKALQTRVRALWFTVSTITSIWFLFWILYDILTWNKALTQARPENYFGLIISITSLILGTKFGKSSIPGKSISVLEHNLEKNRIKKAQDQQLKEVQQKQSIEKVHELQHTKEKEKKIPQDSEIPPGCKFYLGYLNKRPKNANMPEECLECSNVVNCISPPTRTIEKREHSKS
jgi:hypothetical protein